MSDGLDPDQDRQNVGPDLDPSCLQSLSALQAWKELTAWKTVLYYIIVQSFPKESLWYLHLSNLVPFHFRRSEKF